MATKSDTYQIEMGPLAAALSDQLISKHLTDKEVEEFQKDMDALSRLRVRRVLTKTLGDKAEIRLVKEIQRRAAGRNR